MTPIAKWHTTLALLKGSIGEHHFSKHLKAGKKGRPEMSKYYD